MPMFPDGATCSAFLPPAARAARRSAAAVAALCLGLLLTLPAYVRAQAAVPATATPSDAKLAFHGWDVISVKPNKSGSGSTSISTDNTSYRGENVGTKNLLATAYGIRDGLISGLPPWAGGAHWDINAKLVDPDPALKDRHLSQQEGEEEYRAQARAILTDRFHLKAHTETKVDSIYELAVAKDGPKLKKTDPAEKNKGSMSVHNTNMHAVGITLNSLSKSLESTVGRNIENKTGLPGDYTFDLKWTRQDGAIAAADSGATDTPPDIFTALQEQLGLRLVAGKGPVTTLVVDSIDMPSED